MSKIKNDLFNYLMQNRMTNKLKDLIPNFYREWSKLKH